jgi:hypothetical protein
MEIYLLIFGMVISSMLGYTFIKSEMDEENDPDLDI